MHLYEAATANYLRTLTADEAATYLEMPAVRNTAEGIVEGETFGYDFPVYAI